ncbi:MAG: Amino acid polyamine transporter I [Lasallia pustulata]|uniref:Amino acid polyamine transporter I n=1 Tax=Lasallia pustulata TaxID=136370 RepID=A0A5M8Q013_9LECA|nr:MAG: Amino acid polyamine transporter I [Lasallia pustulata]
MPFKDGEFMEETTAVRDRDEFDQTGFSRRDEADMAEQGKRQQLNRNFGFMSMLGFTTTMMCTWEAVFFANSTAMFNGGAVTLVYGFIFCFFGSMATAASLAELVSMAPTSGGQYHWVAMLAPPKLKVFLSWLTALLVVFLVNTVGAKLLPKIEGFILIIHTLGFFAILIPLVFLAPHGTPSFVFGTFINAAGWNNNGLAWFVGLISTNLPFIGYDGPCHMAEEVQNASTIVPWCMICTILLNGILGFAIVLAFCFCVGDLEGALTSPTGYDFIEVFHNATNSNAATSVMTSVLITLVICASFGFLASSSRQTWAFARDKGLPFSDYLAYVNKRAAIPLRSIVFCGVVTALIGLINVGSTVAFNAIVSLTIAGLFMSYMIPITLLIIKRCKGDYIRWGPWRLGPTGLYINIISVCFLTISIIFSFFPPGLPVTAVTMNWSVVVFPAVVIFGLIFYAVRGNKIYHGPVVERPIIITDEPHR